MFPSNVAAAQLIACLLIARLVPVSATSLGLGVTCDAYADFGCSSFKNENHLECTEDNPGTMEWVSRPVRTDMYTLRADSTNYYPGSLVTLHLEVNQVNMKYSGLLLHAVNDNGTDIGSFENLDPEYLWSPSTCQKAAMHSSATPKPYSMTLHFRAPEDYDGEITFQCLIKFGPANEGDFYHPNLAGPLKMTAFSTTKYASIQVGEFGQSCDEVCVTGDKCKPTYTLNTAVSLDDAVKYDLGCPSPSVEDCSELGMGYKRGDFDFCFYHLDVCPTAPFSCSAKDPDVARVCQCGDPPPPTAAPGGGGGGGGVGGGPSLSSSTALSPSRFAVLPLVLSLFAVNKPFSSLGFLALSLTAFTGVADAHNWLNVGRANPLGGQYASTELPCRARRTTDTHAQVGKNQPFTYKWAANHDADHYVIVVAGKNEIMLANPDLMAEVREYLEAAKSEGKDLAQTEKYMRYRGCHGVCDIFNTDNFAREISKNDPLWMDHHFSETPNQWRYKNENLAEDLRANYKSNKYPWIEAAAIYPTIFSNNNHEEIVSIEISGHSDGPGHYIAHWLWNGYGDCADFDLHDQQIPKDKVYGTITEGWAYTRVDHCEFVGYKQVLSPAVEVTSVTQMTVSDCLDGLSRIGDTRHIYGVNVVPAILPSAAQRLATLPTVAPVKDGWKKCALSDRAADNDLPRKWCACDGQIRYGSKKHDAWSDIIVDLSDRVGLKWDIIEHGRRQLGQMCEEDLFGNPYPDESGDEGDDKACYCKSRHSNTAAKPNIPWAHVPRGFESDWMKLTGEESMSQQDAAYWNQWKSRTSMTKGKTCNVIWENDRSLFDAVKNCDKDEKCTSLGWHNPDDKDVTALYTGTHKFRGCKDTANGGGEDEWVSLERQFNDPGSVSGREVKFNFQPASMPDVNGWITDSGKVFSSQNGEKYGWRCKHVNKPEGFKPFMRKTTKPEYTNTDDGLNGYAAFALDVQMCNDGKQQVWELEVTDGVYEVTTAMAGKFPGCWVEGVKHGFQDRGFVSHEITYHVSVEDGRLTLGAAPWTHSHRPCFDLTKITVKKVFAGPPEAWLPATKNPWKQLKLPNKAGMGVVKVTTGNLAEIPSRWLFQGNSRLPYLAKSCNKIAGDDRGCKANVDMDKQGGYKYGTMGKWDDHTKSGAVVGVSDTPCTGESCTGKICGVIDSHLHARDDGSSFYVDCEGATGKYIYVQLPGDKRILDFDLEVYRDKPVVNSETNPIDEDTMVCYGVKAREASTVLAEYYTTTDPEDSMFYSTCFVRVPIIDWIATSNPLRTPRWKWHNNCLECDDYKNNEVDFETIPELTAPQWHMNDQCKNCDNL